MKLIIFTGAPASGKSSIANQVGERLGIDVISKDGFKIALFEKYGFTSHAEKKKLSILGEKQLYDCMTKYILDDKDIIIDNNFKNFDGVRQALTQAKGNVSSICFYCYADYGILAERYNERIANGNRHTALYTLNQYPVIEGISIFHPKLDLSDVTRIEQNIEEYTFGENVIKLDTNNINKDFTTLCDVAYKNILKL